MRMLLTPLLVGALIAAAPAFAVEEHHPDEATKPQAAAPAKAAAQDVEKTTQRMKDNLKKMEGQVEKIRKARDPAERERLLQEHMQSMRENMMMGQSLAAGPGAMGMMGGGMMDQCMRMMGGPGGMGMMGGGAGPEAMMGRMQQMEKRMDMMQMMMEQMLKAQGQAAPAR